MVQEGGANNFGLNDNYEYSEYVFDSATATAPYVATAELRNWPQFIFGRVLKDIAAVKVIEVEIPFSWYVFNTNNNTFQLFEGGPGITVTIPVGNYNATTIATALAAALTAASAASGGSFVYTVTYDAASGKLIFTSNAGISATFTFGLNNDLRTYLGFVNGAIPLSSVGPNPSLSSLGPINVTGPNYLFVNSNTLGTVIQLYLPQSFVSNGNLGPELSQVPINVNPGGVIIWQAPDPQKWFDVGALNNLDRIDMWLKLGGVDNPQVPLELNGQSFIIKLGVLSNRRTTDQLMGGGANRSRVERRNVGI